MKQVTTAVNHSNEWEMQVVNKMTSLRSSSTPSTKTSSSNQS